MDRAHKNQSRADPHPAWAAFLGECDESILAAEIDERSVRQRAYETGRWLFSQVAAALSVADEVGGREFVRKLIESGRETRSARYALYRENTEEAREGLWEATLN